MIALHLMTEAALDKATIMISNGPCIPWEQAPTSYTALLFAKGAVLLRPSRLNFILYF